jgi:hypothetical protein
MSRIVDNLIAYRILSMLVTPFEDTKAHKLGIIDAKGNILRKSSELKTDEERENYTYLHRLVFNLKRIINKLPGGESKLKSIVAALFLIKECYEKNETTALLEEKYIAILTAMEEKNITLVEEEILVEEFFMLNEDGEGALPANHTGSATNTDIPVVRNKKGRRYASFVVNDEIFKRFQKGKKKFSKWSDYLNMENEGEKLIYHYAKKNPKGIIVLQNGKEQKAIRFNRNGGGKWHKLSRNNKKPTEIVETEVV